MTCKDALPIATMRALETALARALGADRVSIGESRRLSGGAIQENWMLDARVWHDEAQSKTRWVLRRDAAASVDSSRSRMDEAALLSTVVAVGVQAPAPLLADAGALLGFPFFVMDMLPGTAAAHRLTRDATLVPDRALLMRDLGANLARIHSLRPPSDGLGFLGATPAQPLQQRVLQLQQQLDELGEARPALEYGLRWALRHAPDPSPVVLTHGDYRTGNLMVHEGRLSGALDWEFAGWGDAREDIGWFAARCWRFARPDLHGGGLGALEDFLDAYAQAGGEAFTLADIQFWEVLAHLRWAVIALQQAHRHWSGRQRSLELALTGRMVAELELGALRATKEMR